MLYYNNSFFTASIMLPCLMDLEEIQYAHRIAAKTPAMYINIAVP